MNKNRRISKFFVRSEAPIGPQMPLLFSSNYYLAQLIGSTYILIFFANLIAQTITTFLRLRLWLASVSFIVAVAVGQGKCNHYVQNV